MNQPDSAAVRRIIQSAESLTSSEWSAVEVTCAFHRHLRQGELTERQYHELLRACHKHIDGGLWTLIPLDSRFLRAVSVAMRSVPAGLFLRSGDAVHLVAAQHSGEHDVWTSDRHMLAAAPHFGLAGRIAE